MLTDAQLEESRRRMAGIFGSRSNHLIFQLQHFAETLQSFDATFFNREPILGIKLDIGFANKLKPALTYLKTRRLSELLKRITFSDGTTVCVTDIWTLNYMPAGGISIAELEAADLAQAEVRAGAGGETVREMIRETYRCRSAAEEDYLVRRWIAS